MTGVALRVSGLALICVMAGSSLLTGCDSGSQKATPEVPFEKNGEAVRFVRGLREALVSGRRPPNEEVQRLKAIGIEYPDEAFVSEILLSILPALNDWDGMALHFEAKSQLTMAERGTLARVYIKQANYGAARDVIQPVVDAAPSDIEGNALLARAHYFFGDYDLARKHYDRIWPAILTEKRLGDMTFRAMIHFDDGQATRALEILEAALDGAPDSIALHNALGRILAAEGRQAEAEVHSARASELQEELNRTETSAVLRAARIFALNRALEAGDTDGCQRMIFEYLPDSDANFQEELYRFLTGIYRAAGRELEIPAVLERARQEARKGNSR